MMKNSILPALLMLPALACASSELAKDPPPLTLEELPGLYGPAGPIGFLELGLDGAFECFVINGMTADGCASFEGAGVSRGDWWFEEDVLHFDPSNEPPEVLLKLSESWALLGPGGLLFFVEDREYFLVKQTAEAQALRQDSN